jgi:hypothetical protein
MKLSNFKNCLALMCVPFELEPRNPLNLQDGETPLRVVGARFLQNPN